MLVSSEQEARIDRTSFGELSLSNGIIGWEVGIASWLSVIRVFQVFFPMMIDTDFELAYPSLTEWVRKELPEVQNKTDVWTAFLQYSELSETEAKATIETNFSHPTLRSADWLYGNANGAFSGTTYPDIIFLDDEVCEHFETDSDDPTIGPKIILLVESTILHEIVHWGDFKDGVDQFGEEGRAFEIHAYGFNVHRYW